LYLAIVCLIIIALSMTACGQIEDTNGDDPSLVTITREKLASNSTSHTASGVTTRTNRSKTTSVGSMEEIDVDFLNMKGGKTSGIKNIMLTMLAAGEKVTIDCSSSVASGNLAIVLLSPDNEILYDFAVGEEDACAITASESGEYVVRIGAESFSGEINLERTFG
jgi:hypothetical protein